jgi:hypothetical protein
MAAALVFGAFACTMQGPAIAKDDGVFAPLGGSWAGSGQVRFEGGKSERITCRAYYTPREGGAGLSVALRCASASNKIELRSTMSSTAGRVTGSWEERTYNASGTLTGRASRGNLTLAFSGGGLSGSMQVSTSGSSQQVSISTSGGGLTGVSISLAHLR